MKPRGTTMKPRGTTMKPKKPTSTLRKKSDAWVIVGSNIECDEGAGEVYRRNSPGKVETLEQCQKSCEDQAACKSITYFNSGWCSHFSTSCSNFKRKGKAVSMNKREGSIGSAGEREAAGVGTWSIVG